MSDLPQGIKFFHIAHQKDSIFKTTFPTVSGQNLGRHTIAYTQRCVFQRSKDNSYFLEKVKEIGISRSRVTFKINLIKFLSFEC